MPEEEQQLSYYQESIRRLTRAGYEHYEISNFSKPGKQCRHNKIYWNNGDALGFGAGASRFINGMRSKNIDLPSDYIKKISKDGDATESSECLQKEDSMAETLMLGLRMLKGVDILEFEARYNVSFISHYQKILDKLSQNDLIHLTGKQLALTTKGLYLADSVIMEFMN